MADSSRLYFRQILAGMDIAEDTTPSPSRWSTSST
jgi:hypothetical protein